MPICRNCGVEISSTQFSNFNGMCPDCKRMAPVQRELKRQNNYSKWGGYFGLGLFLFFLIIFLIFGL